ARPTGRASLSIRTHEGGGTRIRGEDPCIHASTRAPRALPGASVMRSPGPWRPTPRRAAAGLALCFVVWALFVGVATARAQHRPFRLDDLGRIRGISDVQLSPDGSRAVYVRTMTDFAADRTMSELVLLTIETGESSVLARGSSPRWSPDGRWIAFRTTESGAPAIVLHEVATGARRHLVNIYETDHFLGRVEKNFAWSPDGKWVAYIGADPAPP